ncbi:hypothetical protein DL95DRAFT_397425 [Leptodontidium sp. 2 PMI_412]|nr:hypothetical protein DL95DRAFT_397425 [Leptodontidium sp. 2 PMI_412]
MPVRHAFTFAYFYAQRILDQVAGRSERRYDRMVGEGDELDNWDYANIRWINLGSKLWITDSGVLERGSSESDILWSHSLSAARS